MADKNQTKNWKSQNSNLTQALEEWTNISNEVKVEGKIAPDHKMLKEIEGLLIELKSKLDEFSTPKVKNDSSELSDHSDLSEHSELSELSEK